EEMRGGHAYPGGTHSLNNFAHRLFRGATNDEIARLTDNREKKLRMRKLENSMRARIVLFAVSALSLGWTASAIAQQTAPEQLKVTIDTQQTAAPVSKYLYGGFIEHIGSLVYRGLWSELLDDRKFYFPITSKEPE